MNFTDAQSKALGAKLVAKHVKTRVWGGRTLSYLEGWHAVAEANRIFGFDGWDRETVSASCIWQGRRDGQAACTYVARARIAVRAGGGVIQRDGSGSGHGRAALPGEAHESALKEAETDATKRALITFGNQFGLALYDKERRGVTGKRPAKTNGADPKPATWTALSPDGTPIGSHTDPAAYCSTLKVALERCETAEIVHRLWQHNQPTVALLRNQLPKLVNDNGEHFAGLLTALFGKRFESAERIGDEPPPQAAVNGAPSIDKSVLALAEPRRIRDKDHLRLVARQPCIVCGRRPSHAHHLRFAQPRALSRKVSDEWVVPLCNTHHRALHGTGDEEGWWRGQKLEPVPIAEKLWAESRQVCGATDGPELS